VLHLMCEGCYELTQHYLKSGVSRIGPNVIIAVVFSTNQFSSLKA